LRARQHDRVVLLHRSPARRLTLPLRRRGLSHLLVGRLDLQVLQVPDHIRLNDAAIHDDRLLGELPHQRVH
jgi:hypothetical protein